MDIYYKKRPKAGPAQLLPTPIDADGEHLQLLSSEYDRYRRTLLQTDEGEGWSSELRRYLNNRPGDVTKDTDIVGWWQVTQVSLFIDLIVSNLCQDHAALFPTLAQIALDILPCQASSVPCERLFSASKQTADLRRASLGAKRFEELQIMKFAWRKKVSDLAARNWAQVEQVELGEYCEILEADETSAEWDKEFLDADEFIIDYSE